MKTKLTASRSYFPPFRRRAYLDKPLKDLVLATPHAEFGLRIPAPGIPLSTVAIPYPYFTWITQNTVSIQQIFVYLNLRTIGLCSISIF